MNVHKNAGLTPRGRGRIVDLSASGQTPQVIAQAVGVCPRTVRKWITRYANGGIAGLQDRGSRPKRLHRPTPQPTVEHVEALRPQRLTGRAIAAETGISPAAVSRILKRLGLNKLSALEPAEPVRGYEHVVSGRTHPHRYQERGKFSRVDHRITGDRTGQSKTRDIGWQFVHKTPRASPSAS